MDPSQETNSPVRNLEKLIKELHNEREKNQTLAKAFQTKVNDIQILERHLKNRDSIIQDNEEFIKEQAHHIESLEEKVDSNRYRIIELQAKLTERENEVTNITTNSSNYDELIATLRTEISMKDASIKRLHQKMQDFDSSFVSRNNGHSDNKILSNTTISDLKDQNQLTQANKNLSELQRRFKDLTSDYENVSIELSEVNRTNNELRQELHHSNLAINSKDSEMNAIRMNCEDLKRELDQERAEYQLLSQKVQNDKSTESKNKEEMNILSSEYRHLNDQYESVKRERDNLLHTTLNHERNIAQYKHRINTLEEEKSGLLERITIARTNPSKMNREIDDIREKMLALSSRVQSNIISSSSSPKEELLYSTNDILERDGKLREVYESIIRDLHEEILNNANKDFDSNNKLTSEVINRFKELELENQEYEYSNQRLMAEAMSVSQSACEAFERNTSQQRKYVDLLKVLSETKRLHDQLQVDLSESKKTWDLEKVFLQSRQRQLEDSNQSLDQELSQLQESFLQLEADKDRLQDKDKQWEQYCSDQEQQIQSMEGNIESLISYRTQQQSQLDHLETDLKAMKISQHKLQDDVMNKENQISVLQSKLDTSDKTCKSMVEDIGSLNEVIRRLEDKTGIVTDVNKKLEEDLIKLMNENTHHHIQELQSGADLVNSNMALTDKLEKEVTLRKRQTTALEMSLLKERENCNLLRTQKKVLEERLDIILQELSSYRSLDLYHISYEKELESLRQSSAASSHQLHSKSKTTSKSAIDSSISESPYLTQPRRLNTSDYQLDHNQTPRLLPK